ncbi:MAG: GDSL-type esterase/lipase family protein [Alphaproteobacteria bacterium]
MRLLLALLCLIPVSALADYPDPERKQVQVEILTGTLIAAPGQVVVTGSSTIGRWRSIRKDLLPAEVIATGLPGSNMNDLDHYLDELVLRYRPRAVVIYQGDNDLLIEGVSVEQVVDRFRHIVTRTKAALPDVSIYVLSIKPRLSRRDKWAEATAINRAFGAMAERIDGLRYVDMVKPMLDDNGLPRRDLFVEDGVHLSAGGYRLWSSILRPILWCDHRMDSGRFGQDRRYAARLCAEENGSSASSMPAGTE